MWSCPVARTDEANEGSCNGIECAGPDPGGLSLPAAGAIEWEDAGIHAMESFRMTMRMRCPGTTSVACTCAGILNGFHWSWTR